VWAAVFVALVLLGFYIPKQDDWRTRELEAKVSPYSSSQTAEK
jgi:hypothetical protein